jgi:Domain of unknown function (DUF6458)
MGIGISVFLIAAGAVLMWAVNRSVSGVELDTVGAILMIVGGIGFIASLLFASARSWRREEVVERDEDRYATAGRRR